MSGRSPLQLGELSYALPEDLIAQEPAATRSGARLLHVDRTTGALAHHTMTDLPRILRSGDLLVMNDARVTHARVFGRRPSGGQLELLLLNQADGDEWEALVRGKPRVGERVELPEADGEWTAMLGGGRWRLRIDAQPDVPTWLERVGALPLPPYIRRPAGPTAMDEERYQTVFASTPGAVAAPTAGLHFSDDLLGVLATHGVGRSTLTLHVGPGTFLPIRDGRLADYTMDGERFVIPAACAAAIGAAREAGGRIVAVGTTTTRALEATALDGEVHAGAGVATLFIAPGHRFQAIDALLTNFHLPRTPLLALVAAFAGWPLMQRAYAAAVEARYRFYSYGDAMLVT